MVLPLPTTTDEQVAQFQAEYQSAFSGASQEELESAKCRLIWALVHHTASRTHVQRGLDLAQAALDSDELSDDQKRELKYLSAVAIYNLGNYIRARRYVKALIEEYPDFRQAQALSVECDDMVLRDGLIGVGLVGGVVGLIALVAGAAGSRRR